jgi:hypothetical protein
MFVTYYTLQDLGYDVAGMVELKSIAQHGQVFVDWNNYLTVWSKLEVVI